MKRKSSEEEPIFNSYFIYITFFLISLPLEWLQHALQRDKSRCNEIKVVATNLATKCCNEKKHCLRYY